MPLEAALGMVGKSREGKFSEIDAAVLFIPETVVGSGGEASVIVSASVLDFQIIVDIAPDAATGAATGQDDVRIATVNGGYR